MHPKSDLGLLLSHNPGRRLRWFDFLTLALPGICGVLLPLAYGLREEMYASFHYGPIAAEFWSRPWYLLSIGALFIFTCLTVFRCVLAHRYLDIYQNGIKYRSNIFDRKALTWEEIKGIAVAVEQEYFLSIPMHFHRRITIYPGNTQPFIIRDDIQNLIPAAKKIKTLLYPHLEEKYNLLLQNGEWISFGPVSIQRSFLRVNDRQVVWEQVQQITIQSGKLIIDLQGRSSRQKRNHFEFPVSRIPNLEILLQVAQRTAG